MIVGSCLAATAIFALVRRIFVGLRRSPRALPPVSTTRLKHLDA